MTGHGEKRSRKQEQAITALVTCPSIAAAADQCGLAEVTLRRWLKEADFQDAYREARRAVVHQAITHLQQVCGKAVLTLETVMGNRKASASSRVTAARATLDLALKAVELEDLEARIANVEAALKDMKRSN